MTLCRKKRQEAGFTLVELAVVLMIIGLLIGGILRGQEVLQNARIVSVVKQVNGYDAAITSFRDAYNNLPGDIVNPNRRVPNCTTSPCTTSGNSNGILGTVIPNVLYTYGTISNTDERRVAFLHLAAAKFITGIDASGARTGSWGDAFPAAPMGGGFQIGSFNVAGANQYTGQVSGLYLIMKGGQPMADFGISIDGILTPHQAAMIDRKMDDGLPARGSVISGEHISGTCQTYGANGGGTYIESNTGQNCNMMFKITY